MNAMNLIKGKERWSMIDENTWGMIVGKSGSLPGELAPEILQMAKDQNREFFTGNPQDLYKDELDLYRGKMKEKGWDVGEDEEELFEYAMHPPQYEAYKSGKAKADFLADLEKRKAAKNAPTQAAAAVPMAAGAPQPSSMTIDVNGEKFKVQVSYGDEPATNKAAAASAPSPAPAPVSTAGKETILAPLEGKFFLTKENSETPIKVGDDIKKGQTIGYIEAMKVYNAITAAKSGKVLEIVPPSGQEVEEDDVLVVLG